MKEQGPKHQKNEHYVRRRKDLQGDIDFAKAQVDFATTIFDGTNPSEATRETVRELIDVTQRKATLETARIMMDLLASTSLPSEDKLGILNNFYQKHGDTTQIEEA
jgi:hypothetical protein